MNNLQFFNFEDQSVGVVKINEEPWFVGKDLTNILGYTNGPKAIKDHVDEEDKLSERIVMSGQHRQVFLVNESGLYSLILSSKMPNAKKFKRWVTHEVLPAIRKHGAYMTDEKIEEVLTDPDTIIKLATQLKDERQQRLIEQQLRRDAESQVCEMKPKALFADAVTSSKSTVLISDLAKMIKQNGVHYLYVTVNGTTKKLNMGPNNLFKWMRENHYLIARKGSDYNSPTQRSMLMELFEIKEKTIVHSDGHTTISKTPKVTGKGQQYFINLFLNGEVA